jgi:hypothetical protein
VRRILLATLLLCVRPVLAGDSPSMKVYLHLKEDESLYMGEGTAEAKDFGGSVAKALAAARQQAKGSLAEAIQVRVSSETTEKLSAKDGKASEDVQSETKSKTDLALENIKYAEFTDFPDKGQVTVAATLSKEDYRRQLAGKKVSVYLPEHALKVRTTMDAPNWLVGHYQPGLNLGLELMSGPWTIGGDWENDSVQSPNSHGLQSPPGSSPNISRFSLSAGYNWTPWAVRFQPYFPVRVHYQWGGMGQLTANLAGASAGLGFRWWPSDTFALDLCGRYVVGFNSIEMQPFSAGQDPLQANLSGVQVEIGLMWSSF